MNVLGRPDALVKFDDRFEIQAPITIVGLPPGEHRVTVTYGEKTIVREVTVEEGGIKELSFAATDADVLDLERERDHWRERLREARHGDDALKTAFARELEASKSESYLSAVCEDIEPSQDAWLVPLLASLLLNHSYHLWNLAVDALWVSFPNQASAITEDNLGVMDTWLARETSMRASWAGRITEKTKTVLDAQCAEQKGMLWGFNFVSGRSTENGTVMDLGYACPNYPGAKSPLLPGDAILSIDGTRVYGDTVTTTLRSNDHPLVRVARGGIELDFGLSR